MQTKKIGQGKTEYIIILVLVAIALLFTVRTYGRRIQTKTVGAAVDVEVEARP